MPAQKSDEELIRTLATSLTRRGWSTAGIMLLELLKPFSFICSQFMLIGEPIFSSLSNQTRRYARLLEDSSNIERLIETLEAKESK